MVRAGSHVQLDPVERVGVNILIKLYQLREVDVLLQTVAEDHFANGCRICRSAGRGLRNRHDHAIDLDPDRHVRVAEREGAELFRNEPALERHLKVQIDRIRALDVLFQQVGGCRPGEEGPEDDGGAASGRVLVRLGERWPGHHRQENPKQHGGQHRRAPQHQSVSHTPLLPY